MVGNDIIDLNKANAESNWKREGYLNKIFNVQEQKKILKSANPDVMIWLFWSMKEAAYKIINRESLDRFYSPKKFSCKSVSEQHETLGVVAFEDRTYYTKSVINNNLIHTIACSKKENLVEIKTYYVENTSRYLSDFNSKSDKHFLEKDENGVPNLIDKTNNERHFASISHHGKYLAIVYGVRH
jgi:phosphopantetheinyl transferase (holo-ACP synthase)